MKLAILGADAVTLAVARAVAEGSPHDLVWVCELDDGDPAIARQIRSLATRAKPAPSWEALLDTDLIDLVVVARSMGGDLRTEQLRKFVQTSVPTLTAHPVIDSMLDYYELDMIRRETRSVLLPYLPARLHPAVQEVLDWRASPDRSPLGLLEHVVIERQMSNRSKEEVLREFSRDVDLVRAIIGEVTRIGALGGASLETGFSSLGVQMTGPSGIVARWSVGPIESDVGAKLSLVGAGGKATLTMPADGVWTMAISTGGAPTIREFDPWDPATAALDAAAQAIAGERQVPDWVDAAHSIELTEAIERSLKKNRNIELHFEDYTEEGTFKGTMSSLGCGLLMLGLMVIFGVAVFDNFRDRKAPNQTPLWPYVLLGVMVVFLLLQSLTLVFRKDKQKKAESLPGEEDSESEI